MRDWFSSFQLELLLNDTERLIDCKYYCNEYSHTYECTYFKLNNVECVNVLSLCYMYVICIAFSILHPSHMH